MAYAPQCLGAIGGQWCGLQRVFSRRTHMHHVQRGSAPMRSSAVVSSEDGCGTISRQSAHHRVLRFCGTSTISWPKRAAQVFRQGSTSTPIGACAPNTSMTCGGVVESCHSNVEGVPRAQIYVGVDLGLCEMALGLPKSTAFALTSVVAARMPAV